jgi:hypothetical protein
MAGAEGVREHTECAPVPLVSDPAAPMASMGTEEILSLQRTAGNQAVGRALGRAVRVGGGATKVDEAFYKTGAGKAIGSSRLVAALIADPVKRVFADKAELEKYANGGTDYIGDVVTGSAGPFWYRLPSGQMTVLGEEHHSAEGNVPDVIKAFKTARFMYEPFNELAATKALPIASPGTQSRLDDVNSKSEVAGEVDRKLFNPDLENIVIKALTGTQVLKNEYIPRSAKDRGDSQWKARASASDYSFGERIALYTSMAIHIAADLAAATIPPPKKSDPQILFAARVLKATYTAHQAEFDAFAAAKDKDELIAIYELTSPGAFKNLTALGEFARTFHAYGSNYIKQLGVQSGNKDLEAAGTALAANPKAGLDVMSPAREAIMWQKIQTAKGYMLVGMGDAHHRNLTAKLDAAGIPHAFVPDDLKKQQSDVAAKWVP